MSLRLNAIAGLILWGAVSNAGAEAVLTDRYGKELKIEPAHNFFARSGLLGLKLNNKSEAVKDVSGPVLSRNAVPLNSQLDPRVITSGDRGWYCPDNNEDSSQNSLPACDPRGAPFNINTIYGSRTADTLFDRTGVDILGIPDNVKTRFSDPLPGAVGTIGMYLDEDHNWAIESPVMALPFNIKIYGAGSFEKLGQMASGKSLGLMIFGHYYFGKKNDTFRPSVSLTANYLLPLDVQGTPELYRWAGGVTKISSKGSLGLGFMVGGKYAFNDRWDLNINVGQFKGKIESTLVTYDTIFRYNSPIFTYWPGQLGENLRALASGPGGGTLKQQLNGMIAYRNYDPANRVNGGANLGDYTRTQKQAIDPYIMLLTVGYNF